MRISDWSSDVCSSDLLRSLGLAFDHVVASPAARVGDTIDQLAIGYGRTFAPDWDRRLYLASPATLLDVIHGFPREAERVLLIGHNPGLEELVLLLVPDDARDTLRAEAAAKYPTAPVAAIRFADDCPSVTMASRSEERRVGKECVST